jgi:AcrR family transcriptional regulator
MLQKILTKAETMFMQNGIKSITMDDVAKALGMSKKTLYQYVDDKNDLVNQTIRKHLMQMEALCEQVFASENNAIIQMLKIAKMMINMHQGVNPGAMFDLKKYHPETYQFFTHHKENAIQNQVVKNLQLGIEQGLYRQNINVDVTAGFYITLVMECVSSEHQLLSSIPFAEKYSELVKYNMYSLCTPKGIEYINAHQDLIQIV